MVLEKTLESSLECKEIKLVNPKGNQPRIFVGRADAEAEAPILWPPDEKSQLTGKDPDPGTDGREQQRVRWLDSVTNLMDMNLSKLQETGGQRSLVCCSPRGCRVRHDSATGQWQQRRQQQRPCIAQGTLFNILQ